jgi:protein-tyrosine phosphatase
MDLVLKNPLLSAVRSKVSQDRTRFRDGSTNLDLSYIAPNLIAMGFPASGIEAAWRNHIDEVADMLNRYHGIDNTLIFNLSDRSYDYEKFGNRIVEVGFPDHYSPPLEVLCQTVLAIDSWLRSNPRHVAVVHCVGGKGRTGTVVVCYLLLSGLASDARSGFEYFAMKRSKVYKGVTQASQKRYVAYFEDVLRKRKPPRPKRVLIQRIEISPVPLFKTKKRQGCTPRLEIYSCRQYPETLIWSNPFMRFYDASEGRISLEVGVVVQGDVLLRCMHVTKKGSREKLFRVSFHTAFVTPGQACLHRDDLDDIPKRSKGSGSSADDRYGANFTVRIFFAEPPPVADPRAFEEELLAVDALYARLWPASRLPVIPVPPSPPSPASSSAADDGGLNKHRRSRSAENLLQLFQSQQSFAPDPLAPLSDVPAPRSRHDIVSINLSPKWDVSQYQVQQPPKKKNYHHHHHHHHHQQQQQQQPQSPPQPQPLPQLQPPRQPQPPPTTQQSQAQDRHTHGGSVQPIASLAGSKLAPAAVAPQPQASSPELSRRTAPGTTSPPVPVLWTGGRPGPSTAGASRHDAGEIGLATIRSRHLASPQAAAPPSTAPPQAAGSASPARPHAASSASAAAPASPALPQTAGSASPAPPRRDASPPPRSNPSQPNGSPQWLIDLPPRPAPATSTSNLLLFALPGSSTSDTSTPPTPTPAPAPLWHTPSSPRGSRANNLDSQVTSARLLRDLDLSFSPRLGSMLAPLESPRASRQAYYSAYSTSSPMVPASGHAVRESKQPNPASPSPSSRPNPGRSESPSELQYRKELPLVQPRSAV